MHNDDESLFHENLQNKPDDWYWRHTPVTYTVNSQGYRADEWDTLDWDNSVLMMGCSFVFGTGVDDTHISSRILEAIQKKPVINLGASGTSPLFTWANTCRLLDYKISPKLVIYMWPRHDRLTRFLQHDSHDVLYENLGHWLPPNNLTKEWLSDTYNSVQYLRYAITSVSSMWKCPVLHYSANLGSVHMLPSMMKPLPRVPDDFARDFKNGWSHPGILTHKHWAEIISADIEKLNI